MTTVFLIAERDLSTLVPVLLASTHMRWKKVVWIEYSAHKDCNNCFQGPSIEEIVENHGSGGLIPY